LISYDLLLGSSSSESFFVKALNLGFASVLVAFCLHYNAQLPKNQARILTKFIKHSIMQNTELVQYVLTHINIFDIIKVLGQYWPPSICSKNQGRELLRAPGFF